VALWEGAIIESVWVDDALLDGALLDGALIGWVIIDDVLMDLMERILCLTRCGVAGSDTGSIILLFDVIY
jgi:hypothetical protein